MVTRVFNEIPMTEESSRFTIKFPFICGGQSYVKMSVSPLGDGESVESIVYYVDGSIQTTVYSFSSGGWASDGYRTIEFEQADLYGNETRYFISNNTTRQSGSTDTGTGEDSGYGTRPSNTPKKKEAAQCK